MAKLALKDAMNKGSKAEDENKVPPQGDTGSADANKGQEHSSGGEPKKEEAPAPGAPVKLSGIAIPTGRAPRGEAKYPWDDLAAGESFFVPNGKPGTFQTLATNRNKKAGENGKKFIARKYTHEGVEGVMVWRSA